jgi:hypothetical protein
MYDKAIGIPLMKAQKVNNLRCKIDQANKVVLLDIAVLKEAGIWNFKYS